MALPPKTSNLINWSDANTLAGSLSVGDVVTTWADETGNGYSFAPVTSGHCRFVHEPGRRAAVRADAQANGLQATISMGSPSGFTAVMACNSYLTGGNNFASLISYAINGNADFNSSSGFLLCNNAADANTKQVFYGGSNRISSAADNLQTAPKLYVVTVSGSTLTLYVNGTSIGTASATFSTISPNRMKIAERIPASAPGCVDAVMAGTYNVALTSTEVSDLWAWANPLLNPSVGGGSVIVIDD